MRITTLALPELRDAARERIPTIIRDWLVGAAEAPNAPAQSMTNVYLAKLGFGEAVIENGQFVCKFESAGDDKRVQKFLNSLRDTKKIPIGFPLNKSLEITRKTGFASEGHLSVNELPHSVLYPGEPFGLWENVGRYFDEYTIRAGCSSFLIAKNLGDVNKWQRVGRSMGETICKNLRWSKHSELRFNSIFSGVDETKWQAHILLVDTSQIESNCGGNLEVMNWFLRTSLEQFAAAFRTVHRHGVQRYGEGPDRSLARTAASLVSSLLEGREYGYYLATRDMADDVEMDVPLSEFASEFERYIYGGEPNTDQQRLPFFIPCRLTPQTSGRTGGKIYRFPDVCRIFGLPRSASRHLLSVLNNQFPERRPAHLNLLIPNLHPIPVADSYLANELAASGGLGASGDRRERFTLSEGQMTSNAGTDLQTCAVRFFYNPGRPEGLGNRLRPEWLMQTYPRGNVFRNALLDGLPQKLLWLIQLDTNPNTVELTRSQKGNLPPEESMI